MKNATKQVRVKRERWVHDGTWFNVEVRGQGPDRHTWLAVDAYRDRELAHRVAQRIEDALVGGDIAARKAGEER